MLRIYADFNNSDQQGRVLLNTIGSLKDIEQHKDEIAEGMEVVFYMTGEFEVCGTLVYEEIWMGIPDWNTIRYESTKDSSE
jgi:hypothetical protein